MNIVLDHSHPLADQRLEKVLEEHGYRLMKVEDWKGETFFFYRETSRPTTCAGGMVDRQQPRKRRELRLGIRTLLRGWL
jgi:hypothetical protein